MCYLCIKSWYWRYKYAKKSNFPTLMTSRLRYEKQMVCLIDSSVCDFKVCYITSFLLTDKYLFWPRNCKKMRISHTYDVIRVDCNVYHRFYTSQNVGIVFLSFIEPYGSNLCNGTVLWRKCWGSGGSILAILPHKRYDVIVTSSTRVRLWFRPLFFWYMSVNVYFG